MTFEAFLSDLKQKNLWDDFSVMHDKTNWDRSVETDWSNRLKNQGVFGPLLFSDHYQLEGYEGGDYKGGSAEYRPSDPKPHFHRLDKLILAMYPALAFSSYINLLAKVQLLSWQEPAYYGNQYSYAVEYVPLSDVYEALHG